MSTTLNNTITSFVSSTNNFGIELEGCGINIPQAAQALRNAGIPVLLGHSDEECECGCDNCDNEDEHCHNQRCAPFRFAFNREVQNTNPKTLWTVKYDGSVVGGFEVVSPILNGQQGLHECVKVAQALVNTGATVDARCGFHVHVDARTLSAAEITTVAKRYARHEATIDSFTVPSRRGNNCTWARSMHDAPARLSQLSPRLKNNKEMICSIMGGRYYKLNLFAFLRHGSIEFRQHSGTLNATKIVNWTIFCLQFVEDSIAATGLFGYDPLTTANLPSSTKEFFAQRQLQLNSPTQQPED